MLSPVQLNLIEHLSGFHERFCVAMNLLSPRTSEDSEPVYRRPMSYDSLASRSTLSVAAQSAVRTLFHVRFYLAQSTLPALRFSSDDSASSA